MAVTSYFGETAYPGREAELAINEVLRDSIVANGAVPVRNGAQLQAQDSQPRLLEQALALMGGQIDGDVGPNNNALVRSDGTTGEVIQGSGVAVSDPAGAFININPFAATPANGLDIRGGVHATDGIGGDARLIGGAGTGTNRAGGNAQLGGGAGIGSAAGGTINMFAGPGGATGNGGNAVLEAGAGGATSGNGGALTLTGGNAATNGTGGAAELEGGDGAGGNNVGGAVALRGGTSQGTAAGGNVTMNAGSSAGTGAGGQIGINGGTGGTGGNGGRVTIQGGLGVAGGINGAVAIGRATTSGIVYNATTFPQLTADANNYDLTTAYYARLSSDASRNITGITNGELPGAVASEGRKLILINVGAQPIVLLNENAGSAEANRIIVYSGTSYTLAAGQSVELMYDNTADRWRVLFGSGTAA